MVDIEFVQVPPRPNPYRYRYTNECPENYMVRIMDLCLDGGIPEPPEGCDGARIIPPRWAQLRDDGSGLPGPWILEAGYTCPGDPDYPVRLEDFAALPIAPSRLEIQPSSGWVYAGLDTIAYTDPAPQGFEVALLGITFFVGAVPVEYSWDFGDGSPPLVTSDPGRPWPDHTISHRYSTKGAATPVLTTSWKGVYRESIFDDWHEIDGTGETITTGSEITVHTARTRLVEDPLD